MLITLPFDDDDHDNDNNIDDIASRLMIITLQPYQDEDGDDVHRPECDKYI